MDEKFTVKLADLEMSLLERNVDHFKLHSVYAPRVAPELFRKAVSPSAITEGLIRTIIQSKTFYSL